MELAGLDRLRFSLGVTRMNRIWNEHRSVVVRTKLGRPHWDGLDMCRGGTVSISVEVSSRWSYQAGGKEKIYGCDKRRYANSCC